MQWRHPAFKLLAVFLLALVIDAAIVIPLIFILPLFGAAVATCIGGMVAVQLLGLFLSKIEQLRCKS